jgi:hypothetical protein
MDMKSIAGGAQKFRPKTGLLDLLRQRCRIDAKNGGWCSNENCLSGGVHPMQP